MPDVDGNAVLYHYLQKSLPVEDIWLSRMVVGRLVDGLAIWFHPAAYKALPIVRPYIVRCPDCRRPVDEWGSPNGTGYLRDDNSLIKQLPRSLRITSTKTYLNNKKIGNGWVASHIWQFKNDGTFSTRDHTTNSFIPNLVWLPQWLAKMSDRADSFVQEYLKALSYKIFRAQTLTGPLKEIVDDIWATLDKPDLPQEALPNTGILNFFEFDAQWANRNRRKAIEVQSVIKAVRSNQNTDITLRPRRYNGLTNLSRRSLEPIDRWLDDYLNSLSLASDLADGN